MISVIKINLNQASSKAARLEQRREAIRWATFGFVLLMLLSGFGYMLYENYQFSQIIADKEAQIEEIQAQIDHLQQAGRNLAKEDILNMARLAGTRTIWADKLNALGRLIPHDMAITHLDFKDMYLDIEGISRIYPDEREFEVIDEFIDRLVNDETFSKDFEEIRFASYTQLTVMNQDVVNFEIRATLAQMDDPGSKKGRKN